VNKQEFVDDLAERCEFSKAEAGRAVNAILDALTEVMRDGEDVTFTGFGKFLSQRRRARQGVNPQDPSQKIRIRAANVPKFRPGASLREAASQVPTDARTATQTRDRPGMTSDAGGRDVSTRTGEQQWRPLGGRG
jgi:DNA-binding protein HU-beta